MKSLSLQYNAIEVTNAVLKWSDQNPQPLPKGLFEETELIDLNLKGNKLNNTQLVSIEQNIYYKMTISTLWIDSHYLVFIKHLPLELIWRLWVIFTKETKIENKRNLWWCINWFECMWTRMRFLQLFCLKTCFSKKLSKINSQQNSYTIIAALSSYNIINNI